MRARAAAAHGLGKQFELCRNVPVAHHPQAEPLDRRCKGFQLVLDDPLQFLLLLGGLPAVEQGVRLQLLALAPAVDMCQADEQCCSADLGNPRLKAVM